MNAGKRTRLADVDACDPAVGNRAVQDLAHKHPAHLHVRSERGLALRQLHSIDLRLRRADVHRFGRAHDYQLRQVNLHLGVRPCVRTRRAGLHRRLRRLTRQLHQVDGRIEPAWQRRNLFSAQPCGSAQHRFHRLDVARASTEHAGERLTRLSFSRVEVLRQQRVRGQELRRRAVAALDGACLDERLLQQVKPFGVLPPLLRVLAQRLDCAHSMAVSLRREQRARRDRQAVQQHRTRAALTRLAPAFDAEDAVAAQRVEQRFVDRDIPGLGGVVQSEVELHR